MLASLSSSPASCGHPLSTFNRTVIRRIISGIDNTSPTTIHASVKEKVLVFRLPSKLIRKNQVNLTIMVVSTVDELSEGSPNLCCCPSSSIHLLCIFHARSTSQVRLFPPMLSLRWLENLDGPASYSSCLILAVALVAVSLVRYLLE